MKTVPLIVLLGLSSLSSCFADEGGKVPESVANAAATDFFEAKIRPVLVQHCYKCHSGESTPIQGSLLLDSAVGVRKGGDSGPSVVPGRIEESLLLSAMKYDGLEMPPNKKLPDNVIADFETWIRNGAVDPRNENAPTHLQQFDIESRRNFWAFQPPEQARLPGITNYSDRIDALVERQLSEQNIAPNPGADKRMLLRRLYFDVIGLPPTEEQLASFLID